MVGTADSALIREVHVLLVQSVLYREVPLCRQISGLECPVQPCPPLTECIMCSSSLMHACMQGGNFCSSVGPHSHLQPAAQCGWVFDPASEGLQRDHLPHGACGALTTGTTEGGTCGEGRGGEGEWRGEEEREGRVRDENGGEGGKGKEGKEGGEWE